MQAWLQGYILHAGTQQAISANQLDEGGICAGSNGSTGMQVLHIVNFNLDLQI